MAGELYDYADDTDVREGDVEFTNLSPFDVVFDSSREDTDHDWVLCRSFKNRYDIIPNVQISCFEADKLAEVEEFVKLLIGGGPKGRGGPGKKEDRPAYSGPEPVEGEIYKGKITGVHPFGVFVEFIPGAEDGSSPGLEGLCHVSELARERVRNCEGFMKSMNVEELEVMYMGINDAGKRQLSRKALLEKRDGVAPRKAIPSTPPPAAMSEDELAVIARAIDGIKD